MNKESITLQSILLSVPNLNTVDYIGTDKNTTHSYINFYEQAFLPYRDKHISLLEIGIYSGGSLYLWGQYFKNGSIFGLDIIDRVKAEWKTLENVQYQIHDAYEIDFVQSLPNYDIIIDDGPHTLESQVSCIKNYLPKLNDGGILIIEDVAAIEHVNILKEHTPSKYIKNVEIIDLRYVKNRYDDILYVIHK